MDKKAKIALIAALFLVSVLMASLVIAAPRAKPHVTMGQTMMETGI